MTSTDPPFQSPDTSAPYGSALTAYYYDAAAAIVPHLIGLSGRAACAALQSVRPVPMSCTGSADRGAAPIGTAPGVYSQSQRAGTVVAASTIVKYDYYWSAVLVTVPDCVNAAVSGGCPATPGLTWSTSNQGAFTAVDCNVFNSQSQRGGSLVAQGSVVTAYYNTCATSVGISEWYRSNEGRIHYLEIGAATPAGTDSATWVNTGEYAGGYQPVNGTCPTGTVPLCSRELPPSGRTGDIYYHHAFTTNPNWGTTGGWQSLGKAACLFSSPPAGPGSPHVTGVYSVSIDNVDWSWNLTGAANGIQWYQTTSFTP